MNGVHARAPSTHLDHAESRRRKSPVPAPRVTIGTWASRQRFKYFANLRFVLRQSPRRSGSAMLDEAVGFERAAQGASSAMTVNHRSRWNDTDQNKKSFDAIKQMAAASILFLRIDRHRRALGSCGNCPHEHACAHMHTPILCAAVAARNGLPGFKSIFSSNARLTAKTSAFTHP